MQGRYLMAFGCLLFLTRVGLFPWDLYASEVGFGTGDQRDGLSTDYAWQAGGWEREEENGLDRSLPLFRYNRVEGVTLGIQIRPEYWRVRHPQSPFLFGTWAYAFSAKEFVYEVGIEKGFFDRFRLGIGGLYSRAVDTPDRWMISEKENTLGAFLAKEDFYDFFFKEGPRGYLMQDLGPVRIMASYAAEKIRPVARHTDWALFGKHKHFRENPAVDAGMWRGVELALFLDTRDGGDPTEQGWLIQLSGEQVGEGWGGDFAYHRLVGDLRRYQPLGPRDDLNIRIRIGTGNGVLPWHARFYLGGPGTLRGFRYKAFPAGFASPGGNRMILGQVEYRIGREEFWEEMDFFSFLGDFRLIFFADAGWVDSVDPDLAWWQGFGGCTAKKFASDVGVGLSLPGDNFRIEVARRTDRGVKPFMLWCRLDRTF